MFFLHYFSCGYICKGMVQGPSKRCLYPLLALQSLCFLNLAWPNISHLMCYRIPTSFLSSCHLHSAWEPASGHWAISCLYSHWTSEVTQAVEVEITPGFCIWLGIPWDIQSPLLWCLCEPSLNKCLLVLPQSSQGVKSQDWAFVCIPEPTGMTSGILQLQHE